MQRPFRLAIPQARLEWISRRVADAVIGYAPDDDADWKYGTDARYLAELRDYWRDRYDWAAAQEAFNAYPQYVAEIEGVAVHFYHLPATNGQKGYPIILSHGWPGSVLEFLEALPLLAARGYDVVVPSLPGYGFSGRPRRPIGAGDIARMWRTLMVEVLGYARFGAQGGDWGASVTTALARDHKDVVAAFHLNYLAYRPSGAMSPEEAEWFKTAKKRMNDVGAYSKQMTSRPQTIGLALADSPIGFASWVLEKYRAWSDNDGNIETAFSKDQLITNIMTFLVSDNVQAAMWLYNSMVTARPTDGGPIAVPMGFARFPRETAPPPREAAGKRFNIVHWQDMPKGGHFAAWEEPELFASEVAGFFDRWR
ncbi:alpha/beta fold hydrolase [Novosphingobium sp. G106]|uniref:epoxide hydrolase family protein n=1 Tax=Novosphingobium sp. G106 TaxID=2849500 RepID=UPI0028111CA6|nr:alpha/beta fold hydrolase [Novosphingobium sp. G106]